MDRSIVTLKRPSSPTQTRHISKTIGYYATTVALGLVAGSLGPALPGLAEHTHTQLSEISFIFTAHSLGYLPSALRAARLFDRVPGHLLMAAALFVMAAMMALAPVTSQLWLLTIVLMISGAAEGVLNVGNNALLVWIHRDKVGPFITGLHSCFGIGAFLAPMIVAQAILINGDITWAYWVLALSTLPAAAWFLRIPSPTAREDSGTGPRGQVNHLLVASIALFFFFYVGAEASFGGWIFSYAVALDLGSKAAAAYLTSAFWAALTLGRFVAIPIAARFRPRSIVLVDLVGCLASIGMILLWPNSLAAMWLSTIGLGLSMASIFPITVALAERRTTITGQVTGWFFVGASAGNMSLPWLIGQLFQSAGPHATMQAITVNLIVATGVFAAVRFYATRPEPATDEAAYKSQR